MGWSCAADSDCGGPTSEWPHCNHGNESAGGEPTNSGTGSDDSASDDGDGSNKPDVPSKDPSTTKKDAGAASVKDAGKGVPTSAADAGASAVPPAGTAGGDASADAGVPFDASVPSDAQVKPLEDGGKPFDGGLDGGATRDGSTQADGGASHDGGASGGTCTNDSDGRDAGACFGVFCTTSVDQIASNLSVAGECLAAADLTLVCDGELARVVDQCAQDNALALGFGSSVRACARAADSLDSASPGCIDCYVDERLCSVENCLTPCLAGRAMACSECRAARCGAAFATCSGLPRPSALKR